jgi:hypothetical protein
MDIIKARHIGYHVIDAGTWNPKPLAAIVDGGEHLNGWFEWTGKEGDGYVNFTGQSCTVHICGGNPLLSDTWDMEFESFRILDTEIVIDASAYEGEEEGDCTHREVIISLPLMQVTVVEYHTEE